MKTILQDAFTVWVLFTGSMIIGLILNEFRPSPLPWVYSLPKVRIQQSLESLQEQNVVPVALEGDVSRDEMQTISSGKRALILDARPEVFYQLGHIPSAISLPRDDFENQYKVLKEKLAPYRSKPIVVYCAELSCHDSEMVGDALTKLGFQHVRLYRLGWSDWDSSGLPEEKSE